MYEQHGSSLHSLWEPALGRWEGPLAASSGGGGTESTASSDVESLGLEFNLKSEEDEGQERGAGSEGEREDGDWKLPQ